MRIIVFILLLLSLLSCDPYILQVSMDEGFRKEVNFDCGKVDISCSVIADRQISIHQKINLKYSIVLNPEKLRIMYKGDSIKAKIYLNEVPFQEIKQINNDNSIVIVINQKVQSGDTIKINIDNFMVCEKKPLEIGDINLVLVRRK
jgi:hypothetical protein